MGTWSLRMGAPRAERRPLMPGGAWVLVAVAVIAVVALAAWAATRKQRTRRLRGRFGPEYDRTLEQADSRREAESDLEARRRRREKLDIRPLDPASRQRYTEAW